MCANPLPARLSPPNSDDPFSDDRDGRCSGAAPIPAIGGHNGTDSIHNDMEKTGD